MGIRNIGVTRAMSRNRIRYGLIGVIILFLAAGFFAFPEGYNRSSDWFKKRSGIELGQFPWTVPYHLGLDLQGGTHLIYEADVTQIPVGERADSLAGVRDVIERRVNAFGVSEPVVQTTRSGEAWRVLVELAGVKDIKEAIKMIGETPILEFKEENTAAAPTTLTSEQKQQVADQNKAAQVRASLALKDIRGGKDFATAVKEISDDAATKEKGGDIGFVSEKNNLEFYKWARYVADGAVSNVMENPAGYNVLKKIGTREGAEVKARHILICFKGAKNCDKEFTKEAALQAAQDLRKKVTVANFVELAKTNSTEPGAGSSGGELGWFGPGAMVKPFEEAVFALKTGGISQPVETEFGFHIIYKEEEKKTPEYNVARLLVKKIQETDLLPPKEEWQTTGLSGKQLTRASVQFDPNSGEPTVSLEFNDEGKELFAQITERNVKKYVAIFLDGQPISVPVVNEPIREGKAIISGNFNVASAKQLAQRLNAGALPVPITLVSQHTVGASLGVESLHKSLWAGLIGFLAVAIFMIIMYRLPGLLAVIALMLYTAISLSIFKMIPVTLTLSGIAGFILSVGMAVDANVLIFERTKEELRRGLSLTQALNEGFARAWLSIRDSNASSLITCFILIWFGTSMVKGFAFTLALGVLVSMFSAITVTRVLLHFFSPFVKNEWWFLGTKKE